MEDAKEESVVGRKLSDFTTRKVILLVLAMLFSTPFFSVDTWLTEPLSYEYGLYQIHELGGTETISGQLAFNATVELQKKLSYTPLIKLFVQDSATAPPLQWNDTNVDFASLRDVEQEIVSLDLPKARGVDQVYLAVYSLRATTQLQAGLGLATTIIVCIVLGIGAAIFSRITTELVISPIEDMISKVNEITRNPLEAAHQEEERLLFEELEEKKRAVAALDPTSSEVKKGDMMETTVLASILGKIGALLALGFGEAGSQIIAKNMSQGNEVNPMLPGVKVLSIFGFCDIRNFTDATEVLQEGVMLFVNEIGDIVHGVVDKYQGAANKNIGDAFLLVWKLDKEDLFTDDEGELRAKDCLRVSALADMALVSFILLVSSLRKSSKMVKYNDHTGLNERMPNYEVKLGLGLHMGYAIEGAIGSYYKIDASYLSPNVKFAERLESATKEFKVPLLMSGSLYRHLSRKTKSHCRQVDWVLMAGSDEPVRLYTVDLDATAIELDEEEPYLTLKERKIKRVHDRMAREALRNAAYAGDFEVASLLTSNVDIVAMRKPFPRTFVQAYEKAFDLFVDGHWQDAKAAFEQVLEMRPEDPLSARHLNYM